MMLNPSDYPDRRGLTENHHKLSKAVLDERRACSKISRDVAAQSMVGLATSGDAALVASVADFIAKAIDARTEFDSLDVRIHIGEARPADSQPHIKWRHVDGPLLVLCDGRMRWLTWWERLRVALGYDDENTLERKHWESAR